MSFRSGTLSSSESSRIQDWLDNITPPDTADSRATRPLKRKRSAQALLTPPESQRHRKLLKVETMSTNTGGEPPVQNSARTGLSISIPSQTSIHPHESGSQSSTPSRKRRAGDSNTSPSKRGIVELRYLEKPMNIGANFVTVAGPLIRKDEQLRAMLKSVETSAFIPRAIEADITPFLSDVPPVEEEITEAVIFDDPRTETELKGELHVLRKMLQHQDHLRSVGGNEPTWGEKVWSRILDCASEHTPNVSWYNVTTALIEKDFRPRKFASADNAASGVQEEASTTSNGTTNGTALSHKVDYAIAMKPEKEAEAAIESILEKCEKLGSPGTINQIQHFDLISRPLAVALEAKTPQRTNGQIDVRQLATWAAAWHKRMKRLQLCGMIDASAQKPLICLPLISIQGEFWFWHLAIDDIDKGQICVTQVPEMLGCTGTLYKTYQLLASLRALMKWADGSFRAWWDEMLGVSTST